MSTSRRKQLAGRKTLPKNTRRKKKRGRKMLRIIMIPLMILLLFLLFKSCIQKKNQYADVDATQPEMDIQLLDVNPYSRPGTTIDHVNGIVVHYTANPGSTAQDNRDYFNGLKDSHETSASSNFVIGLEGEIIQCIPTWEMAYASNDRNVDTISIECCHPDENGKFTDATYRSLVQLTAWLCAKYDLTADQVIRHYDVTGKICPKYFVEDEDAWVPLGALDYKMRKEMQLELKLMHEQLGITFIFVTHDQEEALTMSDKIVVMSNGEIQQVGTPEEIYDEPKNAFVADFIGESNIFNGVMTGHKKVSFCQTEFDCVDDIKEGLRVQAVIRPEDVVLTEAGKGKLQGEVMSSIFKGTFHEITVLHNEKDEIVAQASGDIAKGTKVGVDILPDSIHLMHFNEKANHFTGMIDDAMRIRLVDGSIKVDMTKLFSGSTLQDGVLYDKSGHPIETEGRKVVVYINPRQAQLSDDPQVGLVQGHIDSLIYMGDHYSYEVRSSNDELYFVYDEYLWNIGDYVSVVVPDTGISVTLAE